ncbi:MAG TPA: hypothetical protein VH417_03675 [Vicinamibacterales bacterium]|jgi:hypothetical protein
MALLQSCAEGYRIATAACSETPLSQTDHENVLNSHRIDGTVRFYGIAAHFRAFVLAVRAHLMK